MTKNYGVCDSQAQLDALVDRIIELGQPFGLDIETGYEGEARSGAAVHPDDPDSFIVGISFSGDPSWARYVPIGHDFNPRNFDQLPVARSFWRLLASGKAVIHNVAFEERFMSRWFLKYLSDDPEYGEAVRKTKGYFPFFADSMIDSYLLAAIASHGLKNATKLYFGHEQAEFISLFTAENGSELKRGKSKTVRTNHLQITPSVVNYACEDAVWCLEVHNYCYPLVKDMFLYNVEKQIIPILWTMEDFGIQYDWPAMRAVAARGEVFLEKLNAEIQAELTELTGEQQTVNINSPAQLQKVLFDELGLPSRRKTKSGGRSTDEQALTGLSKKYPVVRRILDWKQLYKLIHTYVEKYEREYTYATDGRAHPSHQQVTVSSGRFAVSDPPYQQSPKKYHFDLTEATYLHQAHAAAHGEKCKGDTDDCRQYDPPEGTEFKCNFREFIIAPPGHYILGFDFSQVELRMLAGDAGEPALLHAFDNDEDVHTRTAALMLGKATDDVTPDDRSIGKTMNFALLYGMGIASLAERLAVTEDEAERLNNAYFAAYSAIDAWREKTIASGHANGHVFTRFGRKVTIWEFQDDRQFIIEAGERLCMNAPIQGAAADYMKIAMIRAHAALQSADLLGKVHLVMNIHDALEYYVEDGVDPKMLVDLLAPAVTFAVPGLPKIKADWHIGQSWGALTEIQFDADGHMIVTEDAPSTERYAPDNDEAVETHDGAAPAAQQAVQTLERGDTKWEPEQALRPRTSSSGDAGSSVAVEPTEQTLIVECPDMPDRDQMVQFVHFLQSNPGPNVIELRTPAGNTRVEAYRSSATPNEAAQLQLIFGTNIQVRFDQVDASALTAGLSL